MLQTSDFGQAKEFNLPVFIGILGMIAFPFCESNVLSGNIDVNQADF